MDDVIAVPRWRALLGGVVAVLRPERHPSGRFETTHDGVRVVAVERLRSGDVVLTLSWSQRHEVELDVQGLPLSVAGRGPGTCSWTLAGRLLPGEEELQLLHDLVGCALFLREEGLLGPSGPRTTRRVLQASNGVVVDLRE